MMTKINARMVYTLVAWLAFGHTVWSANEVIPVPGFSFESPVTGYYLLGNPDGWIGGGGYVGVQEGSSLSGVTGNQFAFVNDNASLWSAASLTAITTGVTYTLTVDVASRTDFPSSGFQLQLYADSPASGGTLLAETKIIDPVDDSVMHPYQLSCIVNAGDPAIGKGLYVKLINIQGSNQTDFDNVRLTKHESVFVPGFSFESPWTGSYWLCNPDGWIGGGGYVGVSEGSILSGVTGNQFALVNDNASLWSAASLTAITTGVTYTLTVDVASWAIFPSSGFQLQLYADSPASGGTLLAETAVIQPANDSVMHPYQLSCIVNAGDPAIGKGLYIKLSNIQGSNQTDFDNVRLDLNLLTRRTKGSTGTDLNVGANWLDGVVPDSRTVAVWDSNSLGAGLSLASDKAWYGIVATNAAPDIDIAGAGKLVLGSGGIDLSTAPVNLTISNAISLAAGQTWAVSAGKQLTVSGILSGSSSLTLAGSGSVILTGTNIYTGDTTVNGGILRLGVTNALNATHALILAGGTLDAAASSNALGTLTVSSNSEIILGSATLSFTDSSTQTWSGNLSVTGELGPAQLRFGTNRNALTASQLESIRIKGTPAGIDANGYLYKRAGTMISIF